MRLMALETFKKLPEDKQIRITEAALAEFSEKGYWGASINSLVQRLGIAKGSIFQYFGDKKGLFLFVFNKSMEMVKNYLREAREETRDKDLFTRLEKTLLAGVSFLKEHPVIYQLYIKILFDPKIPFRDEILLSLRHYSFDYLKSLLETARKQGEIRTGLNIEVTAFMLDALMDRFLQAQMVPHLDAQLGLYQCSEKTATQWVSLITDILRKGIEASVQE